MQYSMLRKVFHYLNKFLMVPFFRLGLAPFIGNPVSGYIMVLKTIGRKSGKVRYTPVNYCLQHGELYCLSGWGKISDWYKNIEHEPFVEVIHPAGSLAGVAQVCDAVEVRLPILKQLLKNAGFAAFLEGYNPFKLSDIELEQKMRDYPLVRIQLTGLGNGVADPQGWAWIGMTVLTILVVLILVFAV